MKKAPSYKGGGTLIKGEPSKPKKTTIDRTKYKTLLDQPISGTGTNVVGDSQDTFTPDVLKNMGYNYVSGTMGGKDIVYEKGGKYHIYNEQPNAKQNKFGLIDIGNPDEIVADTKSVLPINTPIKTAPVIDPSRKPLDLSNPNMTLDPNTGTYVNPVTGKQIKPIVEQYKHGGKVKGYGFGTPEEGVTPNPGMGTTDDYLAARKRANATPKQNKVNPQLKSEITSSLGTFGTANYAANPGETKGENTRSAILGAAGQAGPIGGVISGVAAIGDKIASPIKSRAEAVDEQGNLIDPQKAKRMALLGGLLSPSKALSTRSSYKGGFKDITGDGYLKSIEDKAKEEIAAAEEEKRIQKSLEDDIKINEAIAARDGFADGGEIKGKGTAKSDSINAKVEEGSFIVPAENADLAKQLAIKILGKNPDKKANLRQGGETPVKLSDGEYMFSPEEKMELQANGIDLTMLAPDAKSDLINHLKCGGKVKGYAKGTNEKGVPPSKKEAAYMSKDIKVQDLRKRQELLTKKQILESNLAKNPKDYFSQIALQDANTKIARYNQMYGDPVDQITSKEVISTTTPVSSSKKAPSVGGKKAVTKEVITTDVLPQSSITQIPTDNEQGLYGDRTEDEKLRMAQANQDAQITSPSSNGNATSTAGGGTPSSTDSAQRKGFNWQGAASNLVNYGLPAIQTAIGLKKLKELGKRPKDSLDPSYLNAIAKTAGDVETARKNAKFGFTGEEEAAINEQNVNLTNAGRYAARNLSGGSSSDALNMERSVINDSFGRKLQSKISSNALKMQKQEQAMARQQDLNSMLAHKQELNRRLFGDTLNAWGQDQAGAGQLVNAGLSNAIDSMKYDAFKKQYADTQNKYQF